MKKIKTIEVGLGRMGMLHAVNCARRVPGIDLLAVCSERQNEIDRFHNEVDSDVKAYLNFDEMLEKEKDAEAVVIISSAQMHEEHLKKAFQAGLHVFMDKPFGASLEQVDRMYNDVKKYRNGKTFYLGYNRRTDPSYMRMKKLLVEGAIGTPFFFSCWDNDPLTMAAGVIPGQGDQFISGDEYAKTSGGIFFDLASHSFDMIRHLLCSEAKTITAKGKVNMIEKYKAVGDFDTAAVLMELENGVLGICQEGRTCIHGYQIEMEITGTKGCLRLGATPQRDLLAVLDHTGEVRECSNYFLERFEKSYEIELEKFVEAVNKGENGAINEEDGLWAARMAWACKLSIQQGKEIRIADLM